MKTTRIIPKPVSGHDACHEQESLLEKLEQGIPLSGFDLEAFQGLSHPDTLQALFKAARKRREAYFGNRVFLYGFLYASTFCGNSCEFCLYRKNNAAALRYRKSRAQIIESAQRLSESGVHLIDLTMGEDPRVFQAVDQGFEPLLETISALKQQTDLPLMISAGVLPQVVLDKLVPAGAAWFACYQETHNRALYQKLRPGQDYDIRINSKRRAKERGLLIEEGLLLGVGESAADIATSVDAMRKLRADQVRVMSFVPQLGTPMAHLPCPDPAKELLIIALLRLVFPDCLIPASLDVGGRAGLQQKLAAGANVITSLIPPGQGLLGVAQSALDIEDGKRTVAGIQSILKDNGLEAASREEYHSWLSGRLKSNSASL
jgi:methylornithine synthase